MKRRWQVVEFDKLGRAYRRGIYDSFHGALTAKWYARWVRPYRAVLIVTPYEPHPSVARRNVETRQWLERLRIEAVAS